MDQMRAAIRARTAAMGLEKSKVSADYIAQRQQEIINAGGAKAAAENDTNNMFGGLDLSKISTEREVSKAATKNGLWLDKEDEMPSMFYDPEDELSIEERAEVDPIGQKSFIEQGLNELKNAKWPSPIAALREVALMIVIIAITGALIIGWDKVIRTVYTDVLHFIPSKEDLTNYMNRFDGLDLPSGWTDNMNEDDISSLSDKISNVIPTTSNGSSSGTTLPEL
jgi:preprotein translocase subunit SecE